MNKLGKLLFLKRNEFRENYQKNPNFWLPQLSKIDQILS